MLVKLSTAWVVGLVVAIGSVCSVSANGAEPDTQALNAGNVEVSDFDSVSLNVQNTDLGQVLQLLSIQGRRNIVPSPKVQGQVTANLYDVTFEQALDAILQDRKSTRLNSSHYS